MTTNLLRVLRGTLEVRRVALHSANGKLARSFPVEAFMGEGNTLVIRGLAKMVSVEAPESFKELHSKPGDPITLTIHPGHPSRYSAHNTRTDVSVGPFPLSE